jgi:oligogalacturonide transport system permease protein
MNNFEKRMKKHRFRHLRSSILKYTVLIIFTFLMIYPLLWIIGASFNEGAKTSFAFWPEQFTLAGWREAFTAPGWGSVMGYSLFRALWNTLQYVIPQVLFMTFTTLITAFVLTRMRFKGKKLVFALVIGTLLMPNTIFRIPMYAFWTSKTISPLWENSTLPFLPYLPLWAGSLFAVNSFSVFMYIQFFRTIPRDLDEAAYIDGAISCVNAYFKTNNYDGWTFAFYFLF